MDEQTTTVVEQSSNSTPAENKNTINVIIPPHSNKMALSIVCTLFCCLIGGIIAIVNSSKSNSLYNQALFVNDENLKFLLIQQSEAKNKTAQTWITVSIVAGIVAYLFYIIYFGVVLAALL